VRYGWRAGHRPLEHAAVLVGAGLSRQALTAGADTAKAPLWGELRGAILKRIYPEVDGTEAPTDPLRAAVIQIIG
jgi:hypothetical protein